VQRVTDLERAYVDFDLIGDLGRQGFHGELARGRRDDSA